MKNVFNKYKMIFLLVLIAFFLFVFVYETQAGEKKLKIALVQLSGQIAEKKENTQKTLEWIRKAKESGAQLVCFPELNLTGHAGHPAMVSEAEEIPGGSSFSLIEKAAKDFGIYVCTGIAETENGICYNTYFITGPGGYIGKQRKLHLSRDEYFYFRSGSEMNVFDLPFGKTAAVICYDNEIPEVPRCYALKGVELILAPHAARFGEMPEKEKDKENAVTKQKEYFKMIQSCRAYDNGFFVAVCNTTGNSAEKYKDVIANHAGGCMIFDPWGKLTEQSKSAGIQEEMVVAEIGLSKTVDRRNDICFNLKTRKPELFGIISTGTK